MKKKNNANDFYALLILVTTYKCIVSLSSVLLPLSITTDSPKSSRSKNGSKYGSSKNGLLYCIDTENIGIGTNLLIYVKFKIN